MRTLRYADKVIEYCFYALFALVPLAISSQTYELFEFNKMWLTFALGIVIMAAWLAKMVLQRRIFVQRTPLDLPILLFLASQIISTIFSLDTHVSLWGYYSRFNGGLFSILTYIFLYYAFVSNLRLQKAGPAFAEASAGAAGPRAKAGATDMVKRLLKVSLISGAIVALWGLPSHFGYDPTCLLFRGTLDVSCWTEAFQPLVRIFSTLGQPNWLASYLALLIPLAIAFGMNTTSRLSATGYALLASLFYIDLLFTRSQSGFVGLLAGLLTAIVLAQARKSSTLSAQTEGARPFSFAKSDLAKLHYRYRYTLVVFVLFAGITFFVGQPIGFLQERLAPQPMKVEIEQPVLPVAELGGTDSRKIRFIVWQGAIDAWKANPLIGTGVETFGFAYYRYRPAEHNLTSEWDFLYNKAHNEYLNYLATTGLLGLGTYMLIIWTFFVLVAKQISKSKFLISKQIPNSKSQLGQLEIRSIRNLTLALFAGYISILASNFFGFSVVIVNLYLFLIPAFVFILAGMLDPKKVLVAYASRGKNGISLLQWIFIATIILASLFMLRTLYRFWQADKAFALGYNYNRTGDFQLAYPKLREAVLLRPSEPLFVDELSYNDAVISLALSEQKEENATDAALLKEEAIRMSDRLVSSHPNNILFWKTRVRVFYALGQKDSKYLKTALSALERAHELAPTDAKVVYNLGILNSQTGNVEKAVVLLEETIRLKPDYRDAYYALGLFQKELGQNEKAVATMRFILDRIASDDAQVKKALESWNAL